MKTKKNITMQATKEELDKLELIGEIHKRKTMSDTIRFLIEQEHEKILNISLHAGEFLLRGTAK